MNLRKPLRCWLRYSNVAASPELFPLRQRRRGRGKVASARSPQSSPVKGQEARSAASQFSATVAFVAIFFLLPTFTDAGTLDDDLGRRKPEATIDLATREGTELLRGEWRYSDVKIVEVEFKAPGPDGQPGNNTNKAYDFTPRAGRSEFDDSEWEVIDPTSLEKRRSAGKLAFNWYRIKITVPERVGSFDPTGSTLVFAASVDDYAEVWVDGEIPRAAGQSGGSVIKGWNAENRLAIARGVKPGQVIQLAIFGINGPISNPPTNYVYVRYAKLEFHKVPAGPVAVAPHEVNIEVIRVDPAVDTIVPANPKLFKLAEGFQFTEGPVWTAAGHLLFSDPNANAIYKYSAADAKLSLFKTNSGYSGSDVKAYLQPGSNGLSLDAEGRLTINEHGNRRITRIEKNGSVTILADNYHGKRLNSPNDLVYRSDGTLFFTDPPFGLPNFYDDPRRELAYSGVYGLREGKLRLLSRDLRGPNGIALSPDEKYLYIGNWDPEKKVIMRYEVSVDGSLANGKLFFDMTKAPGQDGIDGIKVDLRGNLYVSGPGGLWILSPAAKHLGTIITPRHPHNFAWGGEDGKTLYITAQNTLYRMPLNIPGIRPTAISANETRG